MARLPSSGSLRGRVHLQKREMEPNPWDPDGPLREGDWATQATVACEFMPLRGSETVIASRLQGIQPYVVRVRQSNTTRQVDETWRVVDARDDKRVFAIKAPPTDPDQKRAWLEVLCEIGTPE